VVFGKAALLKGADPKKVLDTLFDVARKAEPTLREVYLAIGDLALDKHDFPLAAKRFEEGLKVMPDDPDLHYGLAKAYASGDGVSMASSLEAALKLNSNHLGCLLLLADRNIDAESYEDARKLLEQIRKINEWEPEAWSYRAVLAHLDNQPQQEKEARQTALKFWDANPGVDNLIGMKLSQKYRFEEGAAHQRQALEFDPEYLPAKAQLAQDLLRLGEEAEGWKLAEEVQKQDGYDVEAYNLASLHDTMRKFTTLTNEDFVVRMGANEASIYGARVLDLLSQARSNLCAKYGLEVKRPTIVEVFPQQKDFAVRTFGMPGNPGYLGVCFGSVITANSPASHPGHPINWQAVLWHEFCHVVTLQMTQNKMPRWLSEGISVYEETRANPTWGQRMTPQYREMVLGDELTPVSRLSAAFLMPRSDMHLQFAYYESSLVVEFVVQKFGQDKLKAILSDLRQGEDINRAIEQHTSPMAKFEKEFAEFARERAEKLAPGLDWEKPELEGLLDSKNANDPHSTGPGKTNAPVEVRKGRGKRGLGFSPPEDLFTDWFNQRPTNYYALNEKARRLMEQKKYAEAKVPLETLIKLYPGQAGSDSPYILLAAAHRALGETNSERQVLAQFAEIDGDTAEAFRRLIELCTQAQDWPAVSTNALRYLAVNPLVALPYRALAEASEHTGDKATAILACQALIQLDPADPAQAHFQLAQLLNQVGRNAEARRHVLQALEEAPRYRDALRLLLQLSTATPQTAIPARALPQTAENTRP
jgi:tetratricopeptide (TPR) repeat protein